MDIDITTIVQLINDKNDNKITTENLLAVAVFPLTVFKTEADIFNIIQELKKLLRTNAPINDQLIKNDLKELMKHANFQYADVSVTVDTMYREKTNQYKEDYTKQTTFLNLFASSLYYIQKNIHRTVKEDQEYFNRRISNGVNYLDSKLKIQVKPKIKDRIEKIERYDNDQWVDAKIKIIENISNKSIDNQKKTEEKLKNENDSSNQDAINGTNIKKIDVHQKKENKIVVDNLVDDLKEEFSINQNTTDSKFKDVPEKIPHTIIEEKEIKNIQVEKEPTIRELKEELRLIADILAYKILAEKSSYNEIGLRDLYVNVQQRFRESISNITSKLNNGNQLFNEMLSDKVKSINVNYGKEDFISPTGFDIPDFLTKVSKGFLLTKKIKPENAQQELNTVLDFCLKLISKKYPSRIPSEETVEKIKSNELDIFETNIKNKRSATLSAAKNKENKYKNITDAYEKIKIKLAVVRTAVITAAVVVKDNVARTLKRLKP